MMIPSGLMFGVDFKSWVWLLERDKAFWCFHFGPFWVMHNYRRHWDKKFRGR